MPASGLHTRRGKHLSEAARIVGVTERRADDGEWLVAEVDVRATQGLRNIKGSVWAASFDQDARDAMNVQSSEFSWP